MRVWRLDYGDPDHGTIVEWFPSKRAADKRRAEVERDGRAQYRGYKSFRVRPVEIPTNKAGLIAWLDANLDRDNG